MTDKELLRKSFKNILLRDERDRCGQPHEISFEKPVYIFRSGHLTTPETCSTLFAYLPFGTEADPRKAINTVLERDIPVAAPRVSGQGLHFHRIISLYDDFEHNRWGIPEPSAAAPCYFTTDPEMVYLDLKFPLLVLVPALAFDRSGNRLGRGGGYYDRFLATLLEMYEEHREEITLAGVGLSLQVTEDLPHKDHDISVDCLYTNV